MHFHRNRSPSRRAFSLVEALTVLVLIGVLTAMAAPRIGLAMNEHRVSVAATRLAASLEQARHNARTSSSSQAVQFSVTEDSYTLPGLADLDHPAATHTVRLSDPPYEVVIQSADFGGDTEIVFDGYGMPDSGGSVTVRSRTSARVISVNAATGSVTVTQLIVPEPS